MLDEVEKALKAVKIDPKDAGTAELARHYARLIDDAAPDKKYAEALAWLRGCHTNVRTEKFPLIIAAALAEHSVASDLGPKLLATLAALGATPVARKDLGGGADVHKLDSPLARLRNAAGVRTAPALGAAPA